MAPPSQFDPLYDPKKDWIINGIQGSDIPPLAHGVDLRGRIVGMSKRAATVGEPLEVKLTARVMYFRGSQTPRVFTCMAQPDLGRPLNHA